MGKSRETSALFSLQGLFDLERERVEQEAERRRLRIEAERAALEEAERRRVEEERARLAAEEAKKEQQRRELAAHQARVGAMVAAEVARVRAEVEQRTRVVEAEQNGRHRAEFGERRYRADRRGYRLALAVAAVLLVAAGVTAVSLQRRAVAVAAALDAQQRHMSDEYAETLAGYGRRATEATLRLEQAQRELENLRNSAPAVAPSEREDPPARRAPPRRTPQSPPARRPPAAPRGEPCDDLDPMCGF